MPKYKDRKSIFCNNSKNTLDSAIIIVPTITNRNPRASFSEYANKVLSTSLKTIESKKESNIIAMNILPKTKKLSQIERIKKNIENIDEFRNKRAKTLDKMQKMHDVAEAEESDEDIYKVKNLNDFEDISQINNNSLVNPKNSIEEYKKPEEIPKNYTKNPPSLKDQLPLLGIFALDQLDQVKEKPIEVKAISEFKSSESLMNSSSNNRNISGSNSSLENKLLELERSVNINDKAKLSIKTDSSSDDYSSTDKQNPNKKQISPKNTNTNTNTENSVLSFKYARNLQRKSMSIVGGIPFKMAKRDSISISKKDMNDMGLNLEIVRLGNSIKVSKLRVNHADVLKGLMELVIRNGCFCDSNSLRSNYYVLYRFKTKLCVFIRN